MRCSYYITQTWNDILGLIKLFRGWTLLNKPHQSLGPWLRSFLWYPTIVLLWFPVMRGGRHWINSTDDSRLHILTRACNQALLPFPSGWKLITDVSILFVPSLNWVDAVSVPVYWTKVQLWEICGGYCTIWFVTDPGRNGLLRCLHGQKAACVGLERQSAFLPEF